MYPVWILDESWIHLSFILESSRMNQGRSMKINWFPLNCTIIRFLSALVFVVVVDVVFVLLFILFKTNCLTIEKAHLRPKQPIFLTAHQLLLHVVLLSTKLSNTLTHTTVLCCNGPCLVKYFTSNLLLFCVLT